MLTSIPQLSLNGGQLSLLGIGLRGNPTTFPGLVRSTPKGCSHLRKLPHHPHTPHPSPPQLSTDLQPIPPHVQEFDQSWLPTIAILLPIHSSEPRLQAPSLSLDGMKHRQTHPRGRQLVRSETVTERKGERDGRDASSAETDREARRDGERSREMGGSEMSE